MRFTSKRLEPNLLLKLESWRSRVVLLLCLGGFAVLLGRAFYLQGLNNDFLQAKGEARFVRVVDMPASRGAVMDRNGKMLAISTPVESIWTSPADLDLDAAQVARLAGALGLDRKVLAERIADSGKNFVWLKRYFSSVLEKAFTSRRFRDIFPLQWKRPHWLPNSGPRRISRRCCGRRNGWDWGRGS